MINWADVFYIDELGVLRWVNDKRQVTFMYDRSTLSILYRGALYDAQTILEAVEEANV
jgi:hypothetical protein